MKVLQVEVGRIKVYIGDIQYQEDVKILSIIVGVLAAALVTAVTIGILAVLVLKRKRKAIKEFKMELMTREEMVRKASRSLIECLMVDMIRSANKKQQKVLFRRFESITLRLMANWLQIGLYGQLTTLQIDLNGNSDKRYTVKVLDCDTISQVKQKCCEQIYKNNPSSKIPHNDELSFSEFDSVQDESLASEDITLLVPENVECSEIEGQKWHLSNLPDGQSNKDVDFGDIFLNRLFLTKLLLSECIDTTFENLIDPQSSSIPIRYFIGMLDKLGKQFGVEQDVLQSWKNECYATRVWAPLIGKPDILFDVSVPAYVEPCMDILRQVFVESFTQTAHKINKESPSQKLLFHKDIPRYRKLIGPFFIRLEPVTDNEFWSEMDEISDKLRFSRQPAIQQLYNLYIKKYKTKIINDLEDMEEATDLQLASKLEEVIKLMNESSVSR
ncbi:PLXNA [Mytilus edulis]|uniref:PLXNA n=1 Tax=Mytilus edulis TaxID=6550 RepID=A0A8S3R933_MYTED|nr:PLXNA [Mytilus edulis]